MFQTNAGHICVPSGNIHITDSQQCLDLAVDSGGGASWKRTDGREHHHNGVYSP